MHRPDDPTPIADTLGVLDELVDEGKVREIGCSNFTAAQLLEADAAATVSGGARFVSVQNQWNLLQRDDEAEAVPEAERLGLGYLPYYPLASGLLSGKYSRGEQAPAGTRLVHFGEGAGGLLSDRNFDIVEAATAWAAERGHSVLELALAWLAAKPVVASVIAGATKPDQVRANAEGGHVGPHTRRGGRDRRPRPADGLTGRQDCLLRPVPRGRPGTAVVCFRR